MKSKSMRENPLFMRNNFPAEGKWGYAINKKQNLDLSNIKLISCADIKTNDTSRNVFKGVHHFVDDYRFDSIYQHPDRSLKRYAQYAFVLTPDYSTYADMKLWRQISSVGQNRWVGAYWQSKGLTVIPTVSWSTPSSFDFCFDGIEQGSVVAVGMIGCKHDFLSFMRGYNAMLQKIEPSAVIVFGKPYAEMSGNIIEVSYLSARKAV